MGEMGFTDLGKIKCSMDTHPKRDTWAHGPI